MINFEIQPEVDENLTKSIMEHPTKTRKSAFQVLWSQFRNAYTNPNVLQWSVWYALGYCGYLQVSINVQSLWEEIDPEPNVSQEISLYNK